MAKKSVGTLIIIGGHEDKEDEQVILKEVSRQARDRGGKLVVATVATTLPEEVAEEYTTLFRELGVEQIGHLDIRNRQDAYKESNVDVLKDVAVVFFTGGDQLRITGHMGDSPAYTRIQEIYEDGGTIAGTSAGASVMSETMLVSGAQDASNTIGALNMAPGFGLVRGLIIDQHFAERGRIGRLIGAVAQNPRNLGVGIDENTAIVLDTPDCLRVIGAGAVYVVDGTGLSDTNLAEGSTDEVLSCFDIRLHVLKAGDQFDVNTRRPGHAQMPVVMPVEAPTHRDLQAEAARRRRARAVGSPDRARTDGHEEMVGGNNR